MMYVIDSRGIAHTRSTCEEFTTPALGSMPESTLANNGTVVCADCD